MTIREGWRRVNRGSPCPICGKPDWCAVSADGAAVLCQRVESDRRRGAAGWLHRVKHLPWPQARRVVRSVDVSRSKAPGVDLARLAARWQTGVDPGELHRLSLSLGLSLASLLHLDIGWSVDHRAWSFPMTSPGGDVLGIRLRRPNGFKFAVKGGHEGLFIPHVNAREDDSPLLVCEGPSDTAALLDMGFLNVAGRPCCTGGVKLLVELVRRQQRPDVVIVADADEPGRRGADNLASVLLAYVPSVRVILPPFGNKDARDWLQADGTNQEVQRAIEAVASRRLRVRAVAAMGGR